MTPILPAALENAAECTFPIPEDVGLGAWGSVIAVM